MQSLWREEEAAQYSGDLGLRVYTSRLLGRDPDLVLHGGGNTSVKILEPNLFGEAEELLYIKGSGWDLEQIEAAGFAPVRLNPVLRLATLSHLSDPQMANALRTSLVDASAPSPSVETILHALLPHKYVDHTHADAVVTLTNSVGGAERVRFLYGERVVVIPYVMPGFQLARLCAELFPAQAGPQTIGMVLLNHGLFTFGATAQQSYTRMIELVTEAEEFLQRQQAWTIALPAQQRSPAPARTARAALRRQLSAAAGAPLLLSFDDDDLALHFARHPQVETIAQQGPATPDHVIRTKRLPLVGRDVQSYVDAYRTYFAQHQSSSAAPLTMLDPAPRVLVDPEWGIGAVGRTAKDAAIAAEIYRHTMQIILRAEQLGGYRALSAADLFEMEYWDLEQAKLRRPQKQPPFTGEVALVTGAASGIGRGCAESFLSRGAAVIGLDLNPAIPELWRRPDFLGIQCDVTDGDAVEAALEKGLQRFGGLDMVVLNAGIFPPGRRIAALSSEDWRRVLAINLDATFALMRSVHPLLALAPATGRMVIVGSKNVPAPGPGAAAYSASKAAVTQLARVAALEWGDDRIRVNVVHPNAVFDTGLWTPEVLQSRADHYGMTVQQYKTHNVLHVEVTSHDVGELVAELCGPLFAKTTGAQLPIDGGNDRVI